MMLGRKLSHRFLCAFLCLVCLLTTVLPAAAIKAPKQVQKEETVTTALVRNRASGSSIVIGQLENGARLVVQEQVGSYYRIDCFGRTGYIWEGLVENRDEEYYVNCKEGDAQTRTMVLQDLSQVLTMREQLMAMAKDELGAPYIYGRSAPGGFDCSGLTSYLYRNVDVAINRCADEQMQDGVIVPQDCLQVGDLVFFRQTGSPWIASHVGIYVGDGMMIHAENRGVRYDYVLEGHYGQYYVGARRILNAAVTVEDILTSAATESPMARSMSGLRTAG